MFKAPRPAQLPHLHSIIDNIGQPLPRLASFLDLSAPTLKRYEQAGQAPRPVMLALFWETTWGRSAAYCEADNTARLHYMRAMMLERKVRDLEATIAHLLGQLDKHTNGAANSAWFSDRTQIGSAV